MSTLLTCGDIARRLKRHPTSVHRSIKSLKIKPTKITTGGFCFYDPSVIKKLKLRRPNRPRKSQSARKPLNPQPASPVRLAPLSPSA